MEQELGDRTRLEHLKVVNGSSRHRVDLWLRTGRHDGRRFFDGSTCGTPQLLMAWSISGVKEDPATATDSIPTDAFQ